MLHLAPYRLPKLLQGLMLFLFKAKNPILSSENVLVNLHIDLVAQMRTYGQCVVEDCIMEGLSPDEASKYVENHSS